MARKRKTKYYSITGGTTAFGAAVGYDAYKEARETRRLSKKRDYKTLKSFQGKLKPGDVIFETYNTRAETLKGKLKQLNPASIQKNFKTSIQTFGGGGKFHHAAVYLGKGKIAQSTPYGSHVSSIKDFRGSQLAAKRFAKTPKAGIKIAAKARQLAKFKIPYTSYQDIVKGAAQRSFLPTQVSGFTGSTTCSGFVCTAIKESTGKRVNKFVASGISTPSDIFRSGRGKFVSRFRTGSVKGLGTVSSKIGIGVKNLKFAALGAGAALLGAAAYNAFKKGSKGRWVTVRGRKIFIKG